ncbi:DUF2786 domain-containing protein [Streptomyces roseirectus]|uniref:DUF2786 domain-containing protein n=1 Tax=Streptomyces roseirectus TaxID=2768066 RepID=A0A7H0IE38_9ACTN|nr:DUF2786 domain-containing protein [Streptomyces roseirectus]QNP71054.1 DUF2786 domain-containing protein [Streptomyces roseirectus]
MSTHPHPTVTQALKTALYDTTDTTLDTAASLLAADPTTDADLRARGEDLLTTAWHRGWQPADLVRLTRRDLTPAHTHHLTTLIRTQAKSDKHRGPRWTAQLTALPDNPPPRTDRFTEATNLLELYRLLLRLPTLEPLTEPGKPTAPTTNRTLAKIRALLAKAEATTYPDEAEALTAKAQELMARHSVDEALLAAGTPSPDTPTACRIGVEPPYEQAKAVLLDAVADANHCKSVWNEPFCFSTVVGFEADLEAVELLYASLLVQAETAMTRAEAAQRASGRKRTKTFRQSFLAAYAHRVGARLTEATRTQIPETLLPVLATRDIAVTTATDHLFPHTVTTRLRGITDEAGWTEGAEAADRATVENRPRLRD